MSFGGRAGHEIYPQGAVTSESWKVRRHDKLVDGSWAIMIVAKGTRRFTYRIMAKCYEREFINMWY